MLATRQLRIVIPGGTGKLGTLLARHYHDRGHSVATITRFPRPSDWEAIHWDAQSAGHWNSSLEGADAVINLAGRSLNCRYTPGNRETILRSRLRTTELLSEAISHCVQPPAVWINASTAAIYREAFEDARDEAGELADDSSFRAKASRMWEAAAYAHATPKTRKILLRLAPVMSPDSGSEFDKLLRLVRLGIGGEIGDGEQFVSWIHDFDFVRAVDYLIGRDDIDGPVNMAAPAAIPNHQFMCNMRRAWCTSYFGLAIPKWLVEASSFVLRTEPELVLGSQRVVPRRLMEAGFSFAFPEWRGACENLVERWRRRTEV